MEYNSDYGPLVDSVLNIIKNTQEPVEIRNVKPTISELYKDITEGMHYARELFRKKKVNVHTLHNKFDTSLFSTVFMSEHIKETIQRDMVSQTIFNGNVDNQNITLKLGVIKGTPFTKIELEDFARRVFSWLYVCHKYSAQKCKGSNTIEIYFTEYKKGFPNNYTKELTPQHVNSGYSYVCSPNNTIVVFRLEEWFKVFIHETMHSYGLQPLSHVEREIDNSLRQIIPLKADIKVCEAYVETWARILNATCSAIYNSNNENDFHTILEFTLRMESIFSVVQSYRVLSFLNLTYTQATDPTCIYASTIYKEKTNVFSYYVLCGAFMFNPYVFIHWCANNNPNVLQFNNTPQGGKRFCVYMTEALRNRKIKELMNKFSNIENRNFGLRMSIADV